MQKLAIVTGGTRGIGAAISIALKNAGYLVVANYRSNDSQAKDFAQSQQIMVKKWDVSNFSACAEAVAQIEKELGVDVSILVNNAGIARDGMLHKMDEEMWNSVINTNLTSCFNMSHAVIGKMRNNKFGRIVNISSINGQAGQLGQTHYSAAKAGVIGFTKALALESAIKNITVNAIAPGYIATDMVAEIPEKILENIKSKIPLGRLGEPSEIARSVLFLIADDAGFINGSTLSVNGGQYMM